MGKLSKDQWGSLEKLFHVAYQIALGEFPYTDFVHRLEVKKLHNVVQMKVNQHAENLLTLLKINI